jgi:hypothetical protein
MLRAFFRSGAKPIWPDVMIPVFCWNDVGKLFKFGVKSEKKAVKMRTGSHLKMPVFEKEG